MFQEEKRPDLRAFMFRECEEGRLCDWYDKANFKFKVLERDLLSQKWYGRDGAKFRPFARYLKAQSEKLVRVEPNQTKNWMFIPGKELDELLKTSDHSNGKSASSSFPPAPSSLNYSSPGYIRGQSRSENQNGSPISSPRSEYMSVTPPILDRYSQRKQEPNAASNGEEPSRGQKLDGRRQEQPLPQHAHSETTVSSPSVSPPFMTGDYLAEPSSITPPSSRLVFINQNDDDEEEHGAPY